MLIRNLSSMFALIDPRERIPNEGQQMATTTKEVSSDISRDLSVIIRKMENDLANLRKMRDGLDTYTSEREYNGQFYPAISDLLLGLTNNSGWISYAGSALRSASVGA